MVTRTVKPCFRYAQHFCQRESLSVLLISRAAPQQYPVIHCMDSGIAVPSIWVVFKIFYMIPGYSAIPGDPNGKRRAEAPAVRRDVTMIVPDQQQVSIGADRCYGCG